MLHSYTSGCHQCVKITNSFSDNRRNVAKAGAFEARRRGQKGQSRPMGGKLGWVQGCFLLKIERSPSLFESNLFFQQNVKETAYYCHGISSEWSIQVWIRVFLFPNLSRGSLAQSLRPWTSLPRRLTSQAYDQYSWPPPAPGLSPYYDSYAARWATFNASTLWSFLVNVLTT